MTAKAVRIAIISNKNFPGYLDRNLSDHLTWIEKASAASARLVLFPELSLCGYTFESIIKDSVLTLTSRECLIISEKAASLNIYVAFGLSLAITNRIYISHVITGPNGIVGHYEKVHIAYIHSEEGDIFSPGSEFRVFNIDGVKIGLMICFDGRFPASLFCLSHLGAEVVLHPHANYTGELGKDPFDWSEKKLWYLGSASYDNCVYMLMCNSIGTVTSRSGNTYEFCGGGLAIGPDGKSIVRSNKGINHPHMLICELDIEKLRNLRSNPSTYFNMRRPNIYIQALSE